MRRLRFFTLLLGVALIIVSLARPQLGYTWEQSKRSGREVLIAIDTSKSMLSSDVAPNRLTRAKLAAQDLVNQLQGDRAGVMAFAGSSFLQAPLTIDYSAALDSINDLDTNTIPMGGTDIASVINDAGKAFGKGESDNRCLILFTDGEDLEANAVTAAQNHASDFRIFTVGVGTQAGSIIPVTGDDGGTSFVKDPDGNIVKSKLDEPRLQEIAKATGGFYTHLENGPEDMKKIVETGLGKVKEHDIDMRMSRHPIERYQWPLALGLALIAAFMLLGEKRRGIPTSKPAAKSFRSAIALFVFPFWHSCTPPKLPPSMTAWNFITIRNIKNLTTRSVDSFRKIPIRKLWNSIVERPPTKPVNTTRPSMLLPGPLPHPRLMCAEKRNIILGTRFVSEELSRNQRTPS